MLFSIETYRTCDFQGVRAPYPSLDPRMSPQNSVYLVHSLSIQVVTALASLHGFASSYEPWRLAG